MKWVIFFGAICVGMGIYTHAKAPRPITSFALWLLLIFVVGGVLAQLR